MWVHQRWPSTSQLVFCAWVEPARVEPVRLTAMQTRRPNSFTCTCEDLPRDSDRFSHDPVLKWAVASINPESGLWSGRRMTNVQTLASWWGAIARASHLRFHGCGLISFLSSTWGRADQQASHDSNESGAFCFARKTTHGRASRCLKPLSSGWSVARLAIRTSNLPAVTIEYPSLR